MPMHLVRVRLPLVAGIGAATAWLALPTAAQAVAQTPTISGNVWVAFAVIGALVLTIFLLIMGALGMERRDATIGRRSSNDGWFGIFPQRRDEEDAPDYHHVDDGGDGGEGPN